MRTHGGSCVKWGEWKYHENALLLKSRIPVLHATNKIHFSLTTLNLMIAHGVCLELEDGTMGDIEYPTEPVTEPCPIPSVSGRCSSYESCASWRLSEQAAGTSTSFASRSVCVYITVTCHSPISSFESHISRVLRFQIDFKC